MNKNLIKLFCIAGILSIILVFNPYKLIIVSGNSMYPTFKNGQILLAKKVSTLNREDIVVAEDPFSFKIIKRVKFIPGDIYYSYISNNEIVYPVNTQYDFINELMKHNVKLRKLTMNKNKYFLIGDNIENSEDSRSFGPIDKENILYKIIQ